MDNKDDAVPSMYSKIASYDDVNEVVNALNWGNDLSYYENLTD